MTIKQLPNTYEAPSCQRINDSCSPRPQAAGSDLSFVSASHSIFASLCGGESGDSAPNTYRGSRSAALRRCEREGIAFAT